MSNVSALAQPPRIFIMAVCVCLCANHSADGDGVINPEEFQAMVQVLAQQAEQEELAAAAEELEQAQAEDAAAMVEQQAADENLDNVEPAVAAAPALAEAEQAVNDSVTEPVPAAESEQEVKIPVLAISEASKPVAVAPVYPDIHSQISQCQPALYTLFQHYAGGSLSPRSQSSAAPQSQLSLKGYLNFAQDYGLCPEHLSTQAVSQSYLSSCMLDESEVGC